MGRHGREKNSQRQSAQHRGKENGFRKGTHWDTDGKTVFYLMDSSTKIAGQKKDQIVAALRALLGVQEPYHLYFYRHSARQHESFSARRNIGKCALERYPLIGLAETERPQRKWSEPEGRVFAPAAQ
jgi:hypothetical protein